MDLEGIAGALGRPLMAKEESILRWLKGWDRETIESFSSLFGAIWRAGQEDGATGVFAQVVAQHGLDMREDTPELKSLAKQYGVEHLVEEA